MFCCGGGGVEPTNIDDNAEIIDLLHGHELCYGEDAWLPYHIGFMVTTRYDNISANQGETIDKLKQRMHAILNANRWMMGRVRHVANNPVGKDGKKARVALVVEDRFCQPEAYIVHATNDKMFPEGALSYKNLKTEYQKYDVGTADMLLNKDSGRTCKFGIIENSARTKMCIFFGGNHITMDASTVYMIYKQLDMSQAVVSLNATRCKDYDENMIKGTSMHPKDAKNVSLEEMMPLYERSMKVMMSKGMAQWWKGYKQQEYLYNFDMDALKAEKAKYTEGEEFVSSNDVIMCWYAGLCDKPKVDNIVMAIDARGRVPGVDSNRAGNYIEMPVMRRHDLASPTSVRAWLTRMCSPGHRVNFPTAASYKRYLGGPTSSWARFYHHVEPAGYKQVVHFPVMCDESQQAGMMGFEYEMFTFVPNKGKLACLIISKRPNDVNEKKLEGSSLIAEKLMDA